MPTALIEASWLMCARRVASASGFADTSSTGAVGAAYGLTVLMVPLRPPTPIPAPAPHAAADSRYPPGSDRHGRSRRAEWRPVSLDRLPASCELRKPPPPSHDR